MDTCTGKMYIGAHKGSTDDGYICSSKVMLPIYKDRPSTFIREILQVCETYEEAREVEIRMLTEVNAAENPIYYNRSNGDGGARTGNGFTGKHSQATKKIIAEKKRGRPSWNKGKSWSAESRLKISKARQGQESWNKGQPASSETKKRLLECRKGQPGTFTGRTHDDEAKRKMRAAHLGKKRGPMSEITKQKLRDKAIARMRNGR